MRKPRPASYNPAQALNLIANDRNGTPLSCPSCSGSIERDPADVPPPPRCQVTLRCTNCGRVVSKDKAIKRFQQRNMVDASSKRDIQENYAYNTADFQMPKIYVKLSY